MNFPMVNDVWANYFEDVAPRTDLQNLNQLNPGQTARYLLEHPELDPNWFSHVTNLLDFIEDTFGGTDEGEPGLQYGARVISEQMIYKYKMASHTARFGAVHAMLYAATGNLGAKEKACRSLNWSTYMCRTNGVVIEGPTEYIVSPACWFTDGHGEFVRHFMLAIGAVPEWAPPGEDHLTHSTTVIKNVSYSTNRITYTTFANGSLETLRISFAPVAVLADGQLLSERAELSLPGWVYTPSNGVLRIRHDSGTRVQILDLTPALALGVPPQTTEEIAATGFRLTLTANLPGTYLIQRTQDFVAWDNVQELAYTNGVMEVTNAPGGHAAFYRALLQ
jgi:hypothetical protein